MKIVRLLHPRIVDVGRRTLVNRRRRLTDFHYDDWFPKEPNVGYETLLYDVMIGDPTLFMRVDMVQQAWRIVQPVLDAWAAQKADVPGYDSGSDGPKAADELLAHNGDRAWRAVNLPTKQKP